MPTAFESFVNAELPKRISIATSSGAVGYPKFTGVGKVTEFVKCEYAKAVAPTVNDDSGDGYVVGSCWFDTTGNHPWMCLDATEGAAVWKQLDTAVPSWTKKDVHVQWFEYPQNGTYILRGICNNTVDLTLYRVQAETDTGTVDIQLYNRVDGSLGIGTTGLLTDPLTADSNSEWTSDFNTALIASGAIFIDFSNIAGSPAWVAVKVYYMKSEHT